MQTVEVAKKDLDYEAYVKRSAVEGDYARLITEPCLITHNGAPIILYDAIPESGTLKKTERTAGLKTTSRVFGFQPRLPLRRDFCTATSLAAEQPEDNKTICELGFELNEHYRKFFEEKYNLHEAWSKEKVLPEWRFEKAPFTSGIINKNNPLKYHFDAGNIKDVCSCMAVFKKEVSGGYLSIPEYDIGIKLSNRTLLIFDGQSILHGVTPIYKTGVNAYRYSIVYYTLLQMWKCEPLDQELARIKNIKSARERKRMINQSVDLHTEVKQ